MKFDNLYLVDITPTFILEFARFKKRKKEEKIEFRIFIVKFNNILYNAKLFFLFFIKILLSLLIQNIGHFPKTLFKNLFANFFASIKKCRRNFLKLKSRNHSKVLVFFFLHFYNRRDMRKS